jgi:hypothetical protein
MGRPRRQQGGVSFHPDVDALIDQMALAHLEHHFRYPQKAATVTLLKPPTVVVILNDMLETVFFSIDGHIRIN